MEPKIEPSLRPTLELKAEGYSNERIASILGYELVTIDTNTKRLIKRFQDAGWWDESKQGSTRSKTQLPILARKYLYPDVGDALLHGFATKTQDSRRIRLEGNPWLTEAVVVRDYPLLREERQRAKHRSPPARYLQFCEISAEMLHQRVLAIEEITPTERVWGKVSPIITELQDIAAEGKTDTLRWYANFDKGHARYVIRDSEGAIEDLKVALQFAPTAETRAATLRPLGLALSSRRKIDEFEEVEAEAIHILDSGQCGNMEMVCLVREGILRALGRLQSSRAFTVMPKVYNDLIKMSVENERVPLRIIQFYRTLVEILPLLGERDRQLVTDIANEGYQLVQIFRYPPYITPFININN